MNPILEEIIKEAKAIQSLKRDILNSHSKMWRLQDSFMKRTKSFEELVTRFQGHIENILKENNGH